MASEGVIAPWFSGRSILITGGTGFMGKALVEKILRACPDVKNIYLLLRPKKNQDPNQRLHSLITQPLFEPLRLAQPQVFTKLIAIAGDITLPDLGISAADQDVLLANVSIVFHSAATVKFDEVLKVSVNMNTVGTKRLVRLCQQMPHLQALIHVSTAYCNCDRPVIGETVYTPSTDPEKIIQSIESLDDDTLDAITPKIIGNHPNTYTFTKALAEYALVESCGNLPVAIVRPSIVTAALAEPLPGWIDNLNGPTGLFVGAGKGVLRTILCHREMRADIVPVDIAISLLICVAWHTATSRPNNILVYNCTSGKLNAIKWGDIESLGRRNVLKYPFNNVLWYPGGSFKSSRLHNGICSTLFQTVPAYLLDAASLALGKKPIMVKIHNKMQKALPCLEYFTTKEWTFETDNVENLNSLLNHADRKLFNFDIRTVQWEDYIEQYVLGTRKYILKEDISTLPAAKKNLQRLYIVHRLSQLMVAYLFLRIFVFNSTYARDLSFASFNYLLQALNIFKHFLTKH